jgi:hypothetical protein
LFYIKHSPKCNYTFNIQIQIILKWCGYSIVNEYKIKLVDIGLVWLCMLVMALFCVVAVSTLVLSLNEKIKIYTSLYECDMDVVCELIIYSY